MLAQLTALQSSPLVPAEIAIYLAICVKNTLFNHTLLAFDRNCDPFSLKCCAVPNLQSCNTNVMYTKVNQSNMNMCLIM